MLKNVEPAVQQETKFIAIIVVVLSLFMQAIFLIAGAWDYTVLLGNLWGAVLAVGNFFLMGLTVQSSLGLEACEAQKKMKLSQQLRLLMLLVGCVIGGAVPVMNTIAVLIPQLFPRIGVTIRGLTLKEK